MLSHRHMTNKEIDSIASLLASVFYSQTNNNRIHTRFMQMISKPTIKEIKQLDNSEDRRDWHENPDTLKITP